MNKKQRLTMQVGSIAGSLAFTALIMTVSGNATEALPFGGAGLFLTILVFLYGEYPEEVK